MLKAARSSHDAAKVLALIDDRVYEDVRLDRYGGQVGRQTSRVKLSAQTKMARREGWPRSRPQKIVVGCPASWSFAAGRGRVSRNGLQILANGSGTTSLATRCERCKYLVSCSVATMADHQRAKKPCGPSARCPYPPSPRRRT